MLLVLPCANVPGLAANTRLIPGLDTNLNNLNRNYPKADETDAAGARGELAQAIWKLALDFKTGTATFLAQSLNRGSRR